METNVMRNRSVPTDSSLGHVFYEDLTGAIEWLRRVFGFTERFRYGQPLSGAQLRLGAAYVMVAGVREGRASPMRTGHQTQMLSVFLADVNAHYERARQAGAKIVEELNETVYGEKQYVAEDVEGHSWVFSQHVRDLDPREWGAEVNESEIGS